MSRGAILARVRERARSWAHGVARGESQYPSPLAEEFQKRAARELGDTPNDAREVRLAWQEGAGGYFDQLAALGAMPPDLARQREFLRVVLAVDD